MKDKMYWSDIKLGGPYGPVKDKMYWSELVRGSEKCAGPAGQCLCRGLVYAVVCVRDCVCACLCACVHHVLLRLLHST